MKRLVRRGRTWLGMRLTRLGCWVHPLPLVTMVTSDSVKVIPGGYQVNVPGTDIPLARVETGSVRADMIRDLR